MAGPAVNEAAQAGPGRVGAPGWYRGWCRGAVGLPESAAAPGLAGDSQSDLPACQLAGAPLPSLRTCRAASIQQQRVIRELIM